jgi:hypothetical protein
MLCHNHYDLMALVTPAESALRYRQENRKVSKRSADLRL